MTKATTLAALTSIFTSFEDFMARTMTEDQARKYINDNPAFQFYGLRKVNPATGKGESRYAVRPIGSVVCDGREAASFNHADLVGEPTVQAPAGKKVKSVPGITKNGVTAPSSTSVGFKIWAMFDDLWSIRKEPFSKSMMEMTAMTRGFNLGNVATECSRWRKFNAMEWKP